MHDASSPPVALTTGPYGHSRQASGGSSSGAPRGHRRTDSDQPSNVHASHLQQQVKKPEDISKLPLKDFLRELKSKEAQSFDESERLAEEYMRTLPENTHWKVYLELADIAKRGMCN